MKILTKTLKIFLISIASIIGSIWLIQFINDFRLTDMDNSIDVSNLITHNFTNPNDIEMISLFNSEAGHIFNDSSNLETSMKHYFDAPNNNNESVPFFAPFDGKIVEFKSSGSQGSGGNDIWIQHNKYPNVFVRFFHIKGSEKVTNHFGTETGVSTLFFLIKSILGFPSNSELSIFKSVSSTNSRFSPRDFEIQKQILYSLNFDVITGRSERVKIKLPIGSVLLILSKERVSGELSSGKNIKGFDGHGRGGYIQPYYPKPEEGNSSESFEFYVTSSDEWYAVIVPQKSSVMTIKPFATYLNVNGEFVTRSSS